MKIIKIISGFIVFLNLICIAVIAMLFNGGAIGLGTAILFMALSTMAALIALIVYRAAEQSEDEEINFDEFMRQEYRDMHYKERETNKFRREKENGEI